MGIWAPPADKVTQQCRAAFKKGTPFACLVPNELVHLIAVDEHKQIDQTVHTMVNEAMKLTLLSPGLTWVIRGIDFSEQRHTLQTVYAGDGRRSHTGNRTSGIGQDTQRLKSYASSTQL